MSIANVWVNWYNRGKRIGEVKMNQTTDKFENEKSRQLFYTEIKKQEQNITEENRAVIAEGYQKLLYLDIVLANQKYQEDEESYFAFLDKCDIEEEMQVSISQTMMRLGAQMKIAWYRPLFWEFVDKVEKKRYLKGSSMEKVLHSARCAYEAYDIHEDHKITALVEQYLAAIYKRAYTLLDAKEDAVKERIIVEAANIEWYVTQYYPEHKEEFAHVKENYPQTYALAEEFLTLVEKDANAIGDVCVEELLKHTSNVTDARELRMSLRKSYYKIVSQNHESAFIQSRTTYKRPAIKVGRNDPCPCGSGKKFKQCCGKN